MPFIERWPELIVPNPGGPEDPLGESVLDPSQPWLRVYEPRDVRVVIGRGQDPTRELNLEALCADGVPVHRRVSGGGAVVLAPGMLVVTLRLPPCAGGAPAVFALVNALLTPAVVAAGGPVTALCGHGDLAIETTAGPRKVLGASLRVWSGGAAWLGALLVADATPFMERYLAAPSREPDYRQGRGHSTFCTHLGAYGVAISRLAGCITQALSAADLHAPAAACGPMLDRSGPAR